ncbi:MAG TPA: hypothetical protein VM120_04710, partial [Bryobacteraceae bacterium]|nr:hypothetical protein [Bryobacteraceae bacterium]
MGQAIFQQVRTAISHLNPEDVRTIARQSVIIGLHATSAAGYEEMERFLCPEHLSRERRMQTFQNIFRAGEQGAPERCDI